MVGCFIRFSKRSRAYLRDMMFVVILIFGVSGGCISTSTTTFPMLLEDSELIFYRVSDTSSRMSIVDFARSVTLDGLNIRAAFRAVRITGNKYYIISKINDFYLDCGDYSALRVVPEYLETSSFGFFRCTTPDGVSRYIFQCGITSWVIGVTGSGVLGLIDRSAASADNLIHYTMRLMSITNCRQSTSLSTGENICLICANGYIGSHTATCVAGLCEVTDCLTCETSQRCARCLNGDPPNDDGKCEYPLHCQTTGERWSCVQCQDGYFLSAGLCQACGDTNCITCPGDVCSTCRTDYYLDSGFGRCVLGVCDDLNCKGCGPASTCLVCLNGFVLRAGRCVLNTCDALGCLYCLPRSECLECEGGLPVQASKCYPDSCDIPYCQQCRTASECLTCDPRTFQVAGVCARHFTGDLCSICGAESALRLLPLGGDLFDVEPCEAGCLGAGLCPDCAAGTQLTTLLCVPEVCDRHPTLRVDLQTQTVTVLRHFDCECAGCLICTSPRSCDACDETFDPLAPSCSANPVEPLEPNCLQTPRSFICELCAPPIVVQPEEIETPAPDSCSLAHCNICETGRCNVCEAGYTEIEGVCQLVCAKSNCTTCDSSGACVACNRGFRLESGKCLAITCVDSLCARCSSPWKCEECRSESWMENELCVSTSCAAPCARCDGTGRCMACPEEFELIASVCVRAGCRVSHCQECGAQGCEKCAYGFELDPDGQCVEFVPPCGPGTFWMDSDCFNCPFGCFQCSSETYCDECLSPLELNDGICAKTPLPVIDSPLSQPSCIPLICMREGQRLDTPCLACRQPCFVKIQKIHNTVFKFSAMGVEFRTPPSPPHSLLLETLEGDLLVNIALRTSEVSLFVLSDKYVKQASCLLDKNTLYALRKDILSNHEKLTEIAKPISEMILQLSGLFSSFFPFLLSFIQYNDLLLIHYFVSKNVCSWYSFITSLQIGNTFLPGYLFNFYSKKFYPFYSSVVTNFLQYVVDTFKLYLTFVFSLFGIAAIGADKFFSYRRSKKIVYQRSVFRTLKVKKFGSEVVMLFINKISQSLILSNSTDIIAQNIILVKGIAYGSESLATRFAIFNFVIIFYFIRSFLKLLVSLKFELYKIEFAVTEFERQQLASEFAMIIEVISTQTTLIFVACFQRYQNTCFAFFVINETVKIVIFSWLYIKIKDRGLILLFISEVLLLIFIFLLRFLDINSLVFDTLSNIVYLLINTARAAHVAHNLYVVLKFKKFTEVIFEINIF